MTEIREQIACIRRGESECHEKINEYADTLEKLLVLYEAAIDVYREFDGLGHDSIYTLETALTAIQTIGQGEHDE